VERDFWLAFDLLRSHKDHVEFTVVRDWVQEVGGQAQGGAAVRAGRIGLWDPVELLLV